MSRKQRGGLWIGLILGALLLGGCRATQRSTPIPPTSPPIPPTSTPAPPTATPAPVSTSPGSLLVPGDQIGQATVEVYPGATPHLWEYCSEQLSNAPAGAKIECSMPLLPEIGIGLGWVARDEALRDSNWEALAWEMYVDDQALNLEAFGEYTFDLPVEGMIVKLRGWKVELVNPTPGEHTLRYVTHVKQEVNNGFTVTEPGTLETVLLLTLVPEAAAGTAAPPPLQESWWHQTVFYEVFVRSFADSTTGPLANDGIGDLPGLIEKLDYLNDGDPATTDDLGVTGLWLMPVMQSPSYHGYDVTDYTAVNQDYGTAEDFKRLVAEAHRRGMRILIDLPINHTSSEHPWFVEARDNPQSARRDWYIWSEEKPDYLGPWGQVVWHPSPSGYYYGLFWEGMPDLNLENPEVTAEMTRIARHWLEDLGVDGFRLDAARHLIEEGSVQENTQATHEWWRAFRAVFKASNPEALALGEIWTRGADVAEYLQGDELDLAFDFDLAAAIVGGVMNRKADTIQKALAASYGLYGSGLSATFLTNHDMNRVMSQLGQNADKAKLAAAVLMTIPGVPFVYYGEEIGMTGVKPDEMIRTPMQWSAEKGAGFTTASPWEPINSDFREKNVAAQAEDPASLLSTYRALIRLRAGHPALRVGAYSAVESTNAALLAFLRFGDEETILVAINLGAQAVSDYQLSLAEGSLAGTYQATRLYAGPAELPALAANGKGGFDSYRPLPEIPVGGVLILGLQPAP